MRDFFLFFTFQMNDVSINPWNVESIETFWCLKCPECLYYTTEENDFQNHAIGNHPLSSVLFQEPFEGSVHEDPFEADNLGKDVKKEPNDNVEEEAYNDYHSGASWQGGHFMSSMTENDSSSTKSHPKKLKIKSESYISGNLEGDEQIIKDMPKKKQRKQKLLKRENFEDYEKEHSFEYEQEEIIEDTEEYYSTNKSIGPEICQTFYYQCEVCDETFSSETGKKDFKKHWHTNHSKSLPSPIKGTKILEY